MRTLFPSSPPSKVWWTLVLALGLAALPAGAVPPAGTFVQFVPVAGNLTAPVGVTHAGDGSGRLFILQQTGQIRIWNGGQVLATPFLDLSSLSTICNPGCGERGLLGLAFHPSYESNGFFYVFYTRQSDGALVVARYQVSADPNVANAGSRTVLLTIPHPIGNHNGGQLAFGPDGYLYGATGDGGGGGDPDENALNRNSLLGKILRLDVNGDDFPADAGRNYAIPPGNPFAGATAGADEIWAFGLRNPWRFSFDRLTGDLYIGDVGQGTWEEIDFQAAGHTGGVNYGWDCREGAHAYADTNGDGNATCGSVSSTDPVFEYDHSLGCSVTGGFVFRNLPAHSLFGQYFYGDFCSGRIWRGAPNGQGGWTGTQIFDTGFGISSFGESETGRLYLTDLSGGTLQWLAPYTFQDVPPTHWSWPHVESIAAQGITEGCTTVPQYCPGSSVSRAEMAIFLIRATRGAGFVPPPATGLFADVPANSFGAPWIEQLYKDGITNGCATNPLRFCPSSPVYRPEMAVFLLRAKNGAGYTPPPATGTVFADVSAGFWAARWIEQLYADGITTGCASSPLRYCPDRSVNRAEMAAFLARTFELTLP